MKLGMEVGLGPGHIVLDGDPVPPPPKKKGAQPQPKFSAHVYCGQTAGCIRIPLGTVVSLGPGDILLDEDTSPIERGTAAPTFRPTLLWQGRPSQQLLSS